MPTSAEWQELISNTTSEWIFVNGVGGRRLTAPNGKSIFLPVAGYRHDRELNHSGSRGYYLSASLSEEYTDLACDFFFRSSYNLTSGSIGRFNGYSVRPVCIAR